MNIKGKKAIVTGASKGLGYELVTRLLEEGVKVAGWSRSDMSFSEPLFKHFSVDVSNSGSVEKAYKDTFTFFEDDPDILINNAGVGYSGLVGEMSIEQFKKIFDVNVHGLFYCSQMVIPAMKKKGDGYIINIGSIAGKEGSPMLSAYCGSKFAVRGISQSMYKEVRDYGVKVTCVMPGSINTPFFENIDHINAHPNMMRAEEVADVIIHLLKTPENLHTTEIELRPLMPSGRKRV